MAMTTVTVKNPPLGDHDKDTNMIKVPILQEQALPHMSAKSEALAASKQVELLQAIHNHLTSQETPRQFVWNTVLQIVYVAIAFLFGVFAIFQWHKSLESNQLALIAICLSSNSSLVSGPCEGITQITTSALEQLSDSMFGRDPTLLIVYITIPLSTALVGFIGSWMIWQKKFRASSRNV